MYFLKENEIFFSMYEINISKFTKYIAKKYNLNQNIIVENV
ncbi:hypothetical protein CSCA_4625 [Clostridium scatologenes]|uniref:Uncharacterized protein n=1 Tax=Clostridium scatologenes TaxID=1548 RepID=A0A0E3MA60_CLOSL|nr:hypothetical protein CSCA_4625 [Clostridium scatologenes]